MIEIVATYQNYRLGENKKVLVGEFKTEAEAKKCWHEFKSNAIAKGYTVAALNEEYQYMWFSNESTKDIIYLDIDWIEDMKREEWE